MPNLYQRQPTTFGHPEYTDHYIKTCIEGSYVTYQVLPEGMDYLKIHYPELERWFTDETCFELQHEDVIEMRERGFLKTKRELYEERCR